MLHILILMLPKRRFGARTTTGAGTRQEEARS
jgi:hypothetical protein